MSLDRRSRTRATLVWLLCTVVVTLAPFHFEVPPPGHGQEFTGFSDWWSQQARVEFGLNVLLFMPFGALVHHGRRRRAANLLGIVITVGVTALLISFSLEWLQHLLPGREPSLVDITANTIGAVAGICASQAFGAELAGWIDELRASVSPTALTVALMSVMMISLAVSGWLQARTRLSNWSPEYPLLVGNEQTGDRPWRGTVSSLEITDGATPLSLVRRFAAGESVFLRGGSVARFKFAGSAPYRDVSGTAGDLDWTAQPTLSREGTVAMTEHSWLQTHIPASGLVDRLRETNAFTVRIRCATADPSQTGPARIVSNSVSPLLRNFTVGQDGADLVVRVRTPLTGPNGTRAATVVPGVFANEEPRDILVAYDGTTVIVAVAPSNQIVRTDLSPGLNAAVVLVPDRYNELVSWHQLYKIGYLVVLFLPPALLIGLFGRSSRDRLLFGVVYLVTAVIGIEGALMFASGRSFDLGNVCVTAGIGAVVLTMFGDPLRTSDVRSSFAHRGQFKRA